MSKLLDHSNDHVTAVACSKCGLHCVAVFTQDHQGEIEISAYCVFCEIHVSLAVDGLGDETCVSFFIN